MKIFIWGTGFYATQYYKTGECAANILLGFLESNKTKNEFMKKPVYEPYEIVNMEYDYIIVCVEQYSCEIANTAEENGIKIEKMIFMDNISWFDGSSLMHGLPKKLTNNYVIGCVEQSVIKKKFPLLYSRFIEPFENKALRYITVLRNGIDLEIGDSYLDKKNFANRYIREDYFRYRTFEFIADEIKRKFVDGAVAELGVFTGNFSMIINAIFNEKKMYLFDTFESFDEKEFSEEVKKGRCTDDFKEIFKETSIEEVLNKMPFPEMCIIKKGLFPATTNGMDDERFSFVSIDVDLKKSILEGLRWFYPRMNKNGVIFVHDYHNRFLQGVREAVLEFENEIDERLISIPIADEGGTLIIYK